MKQFKHNYIFLALTIAALFSSCSKDNDNQPDDLEKGPALYVLSEGSFNSNNSSLTYYNFGTGVTVADKFARANSRGLGDTGNDIAVYGAKMYIVVNASNTLEVMDINTAKSVKQIPFTNGSTGRQPRYIVFNKNKAFVSSYDGTIAVIDTASLAIEKFINVGRNPEKMAIANGKLYVANSGGLDYPNYDKTVSVVDLNTLTETKKISVTTNPRGVYADQYGDVYVLSTGNYDDISPAMAIIDSKTDAVTRTFPNFSAGAMEINGDLAYIAGNKYGTGGTVESFIKLFNVKTETVTKENMITDGTVITAPYGLNVNPLTGDVFVTDAKNYQVNGSAFCFGQNGVRKYTVTTGINPNKVVFINQ
jgi:YVTN family beta-propeller protein